MPTKWFAAYDGPPVAFCPRRKQTAHTTPGKVGARHPKEVARMDSNMTRTMTAQSPSAFAVPAYGQTSVEPAAISALTGAQVWTCARVRHIGDMGLVISTKGDFPGTSAWRPPSC
jgi:hypothetical protein